MPAQRPVQIRDLFRLKAPGRVAVSPAGDRVVFELKRFDLDKNKNFVNLMIVDVPIDTTGRLGLDYGDGSRDAGASGRSAKGQVSRGTPLAASVSRPRQLTRGDRSDLLPKWSPDGRFIAFTSDRDKARCLYVLDMDGGEPRRLTTNDGAVGDFAWSPDGRSIAYSWHPLSEREKLERDEKSDELGKSAQYKHIRRLHHKLDGAGWWNGLRTHIHLLRVADESGKDSLPASTQLTFGDFDDAEPRFSPDGDLISFVSNRLPNADLDNENNDIFVVKPGGGAIRKLTRGDGTCAGHSWSPDGSTIAYIGNPAKSWDWWKHNMRVWLLPADGGESRELTTDIDNHCMNVTLGDVAFASFEAAAPMWSADSRRVWFLVSERGSTRLYSRSLDRRDTRLEVGGDINIYGAQQSAPGGPIALSIGTNVNPGDVYIHDPASQPSPRRDPDRHPQLEQRLAAGDAAVAIPIAAPTNAMRLTAVNADALSTMQVAVPEPFGVRSGRGSVQGWILKPPKFDPRRKYPAILQIHGGPQAQYGHAFFHEMQAMAARGYVVCFSNPRGGAGYGIEFMKAIHGRWGTVDYDDLMNVTDWLASRPFVDRRRVGVTGGSYGGFMTNWIIAHTNRFAVAVTQRSVVNIESSFGTSDFGWFFGWLVGGKPWDAIEKFRRMSPLTYVKNIRTPLLIEHEEQDHRCPIEQGEQLFTALKVLGRTVEMVRFEGESHGLSRTGRPRNREARLKFIMDWMDRYLKPRSPAAR